MLFEFSNAYSMRSLKKKTAPSWRRVGEVLEIALSDTWLYKNLFTQVQKNRLGEIAAMCPFEQGRAVYAARVLLSYVDSDLVDYHNACEWVPAPGDPKSRPGISAKALPNGVKDNTGPHAAQIFPNPSTGSFSVRLTDPATAALEISNLLGQVLFSTNVAGTKEVEPSAPLAKGVYWCKITQGGKVVYQTKLIIQ